MPPVIVNGIDALELLGRAADFLGHLERAPDSDWWRDYFTLNQLSMFLGDEGWEPIEFLESYLENCPDSPPREILDFRAEKPQRPAGPPGPGLTLVPGRAVGLETRDGLAGRDGQETRARNHRGGFLK